MSQCKSQCMSQCKSQCMSQCISQCMSQISQCKICTHTYDGYSRAVKAPYRSVIIVIGIYPAAERGMVVLTLHVCVSTILTSIRCRNLQVLSLT